MEKFVINGGKPLKGTIEVRGAKNAATKILAACLLTEEPSIIDNLPLIEDVFRMIEIMESMGAKVKWLDKRQIKVEAKNLDPSKMNYDLICQMRSSILLMGALIGRFSEFKIPQPGGCIIGSRPVEPHLNALKALGVEIEQKNNFYYLKRKKLIGQKIVMSEMSVTATENALLASVLANGVTTIKCAAAEPYICDLGYFLNKMGAKISGLGTHTLIVKGVKKLRGNLKGTRHFLMPDPIEMGTFISLAVASRGEIIIKNIVPEFIEAELLKFKEANANFKLSQSRNFSPGWGYKIAEIKIKPTTQLKAVKKVHNMPYPGFAADNLSPFAVLMTQAEGTSLIHDWMYENRLKYIDELNKMGANAIICDPHRALITGPTPLYGTKITSFDLRAGISLIIAALIAKGQSEILDAYQVDRGYERIEERLENLGADIRRVKE